MISAFELAYVAPRRRASPRWPENRSFIAMTMMWDNHFGESRGPPFWSFCFMSCHTGFLDYIDNLEVFYLSWWRHLHNNKMSSAACWFCTCARSIGESLSQWSNKRTELEGRLHQLNHLTKLSYSFPYFLTSSNEHSSDSNCNNWKNNFPNSNLPFDGIWLRKRTCTHQLFSPRDLRNVSLRAWPWDQVGFKPLWFFLEHQVKQNRSKHATRSHLGECCKKINWPSYLSCQAQREWENQLH